MVNADLLAVLERLTPVEQQKMLAVAEYVCAQREEPRFTTPDAELTPARLAARRFMRENPDLMRLLAQ